MHLYLRLAWRNIWRHTRRTLIVVMAIALTLALMMWYDGLMAGFEQAIYGNAIKVLGGNIQVHAEGYKLQNGGNMLAPLPDDQAIVQTALAQPNVLAASRRIETGGLATSREGAFPVSIIGMEPAGELPVSLVAQNVSDGRYLAADDLDVVFIGRGLADAMGVGLGDRFTLVGQDVNDQNRQRTVTVVGIYDIGMKDIEKRSIYMSLAEAQDLYGLDGQSTEIVISLEQIGQEAPVIAALQSAYPGHDVGSWQTNFPELAAAVSMKGGVMSIFGVIMLFIAGIGILNLLTMAVYERTREIGLLGALGLKPRQISWLFLLEGAMMAIVGVAFGVVLGLGINILLGFVGLDFSSYSTITEYMALVPGRVYPTLGLERIFLRAFTAIIIAVLAAFIPSREAAHHEPAEALHFV
jgi:ABC-type lipoprotein release transport system permease subunit